MPNQIVLAPSPGTIALFRDNTIGSLIVGSILLAILLRVTQRSDLIYQFYGMLNAINFVNPRAWIIELVWYIPLFLHLYPKVKSNRDRFFILLPLFMPPFTNLNGFLAYTVAIGFAHSQSAGNPPKSPLVRGTMS